MTRPMDYLPKGYRIEDDTPRAPRLDDSGPAIPPDVLAQLTPEERAGPIKAMGLTRDEVERAFPASDAETRLKQLEATQQQLYARLAALEKHLGLKDG